MARPGRGKGVPSRGSACERHEGILWYSEHRYGDLPGVNRAAGEWGGAEEDGEVKGGREGDVLVTQGLAALPSAWTCPESSVGPRCP